MMLFSIPSDFNYITIDKLATINEQFKQKAKVIETYGQITEGTIISSGRITNELPKVTEKDLEKYINYSMKRNIKFNYTLNPACFGNYEFTKEGIEALKTFLTRLKNIGVSSLTVTSPSLFEMIKFLGIGFELKASAICEITSPSKALFYQKLGVSRIVIDPDINKDLNKIKNIYSVINNDIELIVNNVCYKNCAYKMFHYNHEAHCNQNDDRQIVTNYYFNRCSIQKAEKQENPIKLNWIRPEDLKHYRNIGIRYFKIQGRQNVATGNVIKTLYHYINENFDGNLYDLITLFSPYNSFQHYIDNKKLDGYLDKFLTSDCNEVCGKCGHCEKYAKLSMQLDKVNILNKKALEFYKYYDRYEQVIKSDHINSKEL